MSDDLYINIPGWDTFQHYKDRNVPWIKTYTELLHKDEYLNLTSHQRGVLHGIWLSYASAHRQLTASTFRLTRQLNVRVMSRDLEALSDAGFIELVTRQHKDDPSRQSGDYSRASQETEEEEESPNPAERGNNHRQNGSNPRAQGTNPRAVAAKAKRDAGLRSLIQLWTAQDVPHQSLVDELVTTYGLQHDEAEDLIQSTA